MPDRYYKSEKQKKCQQPVVLPMFIPSSFPGFFLSRSSLLCVTPSRCLMLVGSAVWSTWRPSCRSSKRFARPGCMA